MQKILQQLQTNNLHGFDLGGICSQYTLYGYEKKNYTL